MPEESQIECCEHQDNANVRGKPFPESISEEREIHSDYDGYHSEHVQRDCDLSAHSSLHGRHCKGRTVSSDRPAASRDVVLRNRWDRGGADRGRSRQSFFRIAAASLRVAAFSPSVSFLPAAADPGLPVRAEIMKYALPFLT